MVCSGLFNFVSFARPNKRLDDNKTKIAKSGALVPLTRLAKSKDMRVQRNATGALLNMTHSGMHLQNVDGAFGFHVAFIRREQAASCQRRRNSRPCQPAQFAGYRRSVLLYNCP